MVTEIETKLIVQGERPEILLREIASHAAFGQYRLAPAGMKVFQDTYYDTPERSLSRQCIAVRTREKAGSILFCIKKNEFIKDGGAAVREELELPWSRQCMDHVIKIMGKASMKTNTLPSDEASPSQCLLRLGLVTIQTRETRRQEFDISCAGKEDIIAKLDLDEVCYLISGCRILHYEIEVEAIVPSCEPHIVLLTGLIRQAYPDRLTRWDHNKLLTGFALERLVSEGILAVQPGETLHLHRSSYNAIDVFLKNLL
jgi:adenylate cyclase class IV